MRSRRQTIYEQAASHSALTTLIIRRRIPNRLFSRPIPRPPARLVLRHRFCTAWLSLAVIPEEYYLLWMVAAGFFRVDAAAALPLTMARRGYFREFMFFFFGRRTLLPGTGQWIRLSRLIVL